jgi:hypothetical protein
MAVIVAKVRASKLRAGNPFLRESFSDYIAAEITIVFRPFPQGKPKSFSRGNSRPGNSRRFPFFGNCPVTRIDSIDTPEIARPHP